MRRLRRGLWSLDKRLHALAQRFGIAYRPTGQQGQ